MESTPSPAFSFDAAGDPVGKGRPRFIRSTGRVHPSPVSAAYEKRLQRMAALAMRGRATLEGPIRVEVEAVFMPPKSWTKRKRALAIAGLVAHTSKPDADNVLKILDAFNPVIDRGTGEVIFAGVWHDDSQIVDAHIIKKYGVEGCLTVRVYRVELDQREPAPTTLGTTT